MNIFNNVADTMYKVKSQLVNNQDLMKLLRYSVADPLSEADVSEEDADKLVTLEPIIDYGVQEGNEINNFISLGLPAIDNFNNSVEPTFIQFDIAVFSNSQYWELDNKKIRLMEIMSEIYDTINNEKFTLSGRLIIDGVRPSVLEDKYFVGYYLRAYIIDSELEI